jgi:hypothetical protein
LRARLIANGKSRGDHVPIAKLFSAVGLAYCAQKIAPFSRRQTGRPKATCM